MKLNNITRGEIVADTFQLRYLC